jgi:hypothetical protein
VGRKSRHLHKAFYGLYLPFASLSAFATSIMISAGKDMELIFIHPIDNSMLLVYSPAPKSG